MRNKALLAIIVVFVFLIKLDLTIADIVTVCPASCNYTTIQDAIYNISTGGIINILNGSYIENIIVNVSIILNATPYISLTGGFNISVDNVTIQGFNITSGIGWDPDGTSINGAYRAGILITSDNNKIYNNYFENINSTKGNDGVNDGDTAGDGGIAAGVYLSGALGNNITGNNITRIYSGGGGNEDSVDKETTGGNGGIAVGIYLTGSNNNKISLNNISSIFGGQGGMGGGGASAPGGTGGLAAGIYLTNSSSNSVILNNFTNLYGGIGGDGGSGASVPANGANQVGFGIYISSDSYNNEIDTTNNLDGEAIYYYYKKDSITLSDLALTKNISPTNLGKIVLINSSNFTITNNIIANFTGKSGNAGANNIIGENGSIGAGIYLLNSSDINISFNTINMIYGGDGGSGGRERNGGVGGIGAGIYLSNSVNNNISGVNITKIYGGVGGNGGYGGGTGGTGGISAGIYLGSLSNKGDIINNRFYEINGGMGGTGNYRGSGGTGGISAGIYLSNSLNNNLSLNNITNISGGIGGSPGIQSPPANGAKQQGFGIYISLDSYDNEIDTTNIVDGDKILYYYNKTGITIEDNILTKNNSPTNLGKIVLINSSGFTIRNNTIANFTGESGTTGDEGDTSGTGYPGKTGQGIYLLNSSNNNITNNIITQIYGGIGGTGGEDGNGNVGGNSHGIYLSYSSKNNITNNTIAEISGGTGGIGGYGYEGTGGTGGTGGVGIGVYLSNSSNNNINYNNIIQTNFGLAGAAGQSGSTGANGEASALYFTANSNNTITYNWLYNNSNYSVYNNQNLNITLELNYFNLTTASAINSQIYDFSDDSNLGIVDYKPYYLDTAFTMLSDQAPSITINAPVNDYNSSNSTIIFNVTIASNQSIMNVSIYTNFSGTYKINETNSSGAYNYTFTKVISDGRYVWSIEACDDDNCTMSSNRTILIDTTAPSVTVLSPVNNSALATNNITARASFSDANTVNCKVRNDSGDWYDMDNDNALSGTANYSFMNQANGIHNISVNCSDILLSTVKIVNFSIDTSIADNTTPLISITSPLDNSYVGSSSVTANVNFNDSTNVDCIAKIDDNNWQNMGNDAATSGIANYTFTSVEDGSHTISVNCTDAAGNNATTNTTFTVDTIYPVTKVTSPSNGSTWSSSSTVDFTYNVTDVAIDNCSIIANDVVRTTDTSVTVNISQTISASLSNANYNWSINCTDRAGNMNISNETRALTVSYSAGNGGSGGGGSSGGGGGAATPSKGTSSTQVWTELSKGEAIMSIKKAEIAFSQIAINLKNPTSNAEITVTKLDKKPNVENLTVAVYQYLEIEKKNLNISKADITFKVNRTWLKEQNASEDDVLLQRYTTRWEELPTEKIKTDAIYTHYKATTPSFSYFAITIKPKEEVVEEEKPEEKPVITAEHITGESIEKVTPEKPKKVYGLLVVFGVIVLGLLGYFVYVRKKEKSKK